MSPVKSTGLLPAVVPRRFLAMLLVAFAFTVFLTVDQIHWWKLKPDYAFGWLVPVFVAYVVYDRWARLRRVLCAEAPSPLPRWARALASGGAGCALGGGLLFFLAGALYRAGEGETLPGSLALAFGFSGVLLGMVYFNVPDGKVAGAENVTGLRALAADARLRAVALFLFPALIWIVSAPQASAVENAVSLFLLDRVVTVVFTVFNLLGLPLVQQGNVLMLPLGQVGVADACSGIRSLTGCLFAGSFLAAVFLDRFWKKCLLVGSAMLLAFLTNLLRSLFLTAWAYRYGSEAIEGRLHDATGFAVFGLTVVGLLGLLPLFEGANWRRWLRIEPENPAS